jgi:ribonucleotide monophosphatase NagD (HAD superfamily)
LARERELISSSSSIIPIPLLFPLSLPLSCDGVVWEGDSIIGKSRETLDYLRSRGKRIFFVTNNATKSRQSNKLKFDKMGIKAEVVSFFFTSLSLYEKKRRGEKQNKKNQKFSVFIFSVSFKIKTEED